MRASRVIALLFATGCTGIIDADLPEGVSPEQEAARKAWIQKAHPTLQPNCESCHGGSRAGVNWFEGADPYAQRDALMNYMGMIINLDAPMTSKIITYGAHEGPDLNAVQASNVIEWMMKERDARPMGNFFPVMTTPQALMPCTTGNPGSATCPFNEFPLDAAGATGAKVQFTFTDVSGKPYLSNLKVVPGPMGVYAQHPMFVSVPATGEPKLDALDRYANVMINIAAGAPAAMQVIGNGTSSFVDYASADPIAVYFKAVGPLKP
jgi:hypothetical protein